jgi:hypothetical protein
MHWTIAIFYQNSPKNIGLAQFPLALGYGDSDSDSASALHLHVLASGLEPSAQG